MQTLTVQVNYRAPVGRVFDVCTDFSKARHISAIKKLEVLVGNTFAVGTRWKELRKAGWSDAWMEFVVVECTPPTGFTITTEAGGTLWTTEFEFPAATGGATVTATIQWEPHGLALRLFNGMIRHRMEHGMKQDLEDLRACIETQS